jgi:parallel beta-helix repeat protein
MTSDSSNPTDRRALLAGIGGLAAGSFLAAGRAEAGPLNPPGAPASTPGPEPRIAINQTNTPGDAESLYQITKAGSYYLEDNLTGEKGKHGIKLADSVSDVAIDLKGFTLEGVPNSLTGIFGAGASVRVTIRNGIVRNWGAEGINLNSSGILTDAQHVVEDAIVQGNGGFGVNVGQLALVRKCTIIGNTQTGIRANGVASIESCLLRGNGGYGIQAGSQSAVVSCQVLGSGFAGIRVDFECLVHDCIADANGTSDPSSGNGILCFGGTVVTNCSASGNSVTGIVVGTNSIVIQCRAERNGISGQSNAGISVGAGSRITDCVSYDNTSLLIGGVGDNGVGFRAVGDCLIENCVANRNRGHGFRITSGCTVRNCLAQSSGSGSTVSAGIYATGSQNRIEGNTVNNSDRGIEVIAARNVIINNTAAGNTTNFVFAAGNTHGPVIDVTANATAPTVAVSGNSATSTMNSTNAWANFAY